MTTTTKTIVITTMTHGHQTMLSACGFKCEDEGHRLLVASGGGDKVENSKMVTTTIQATNTPQTGTNQHAC